MGLAQTKGHVMTQLEPVNVILDMKEILVKVHWWKNATLSKFKNNFYLHIHLYNYCGWKIFLFLSIDKSCPGGLVPCNGNGQCDLTIGVCNCDEGHQGTDCSGNTFDNDFYST